MFDWQSQVSPDFDVATHLNHRLVTPPVSGVQALVAIDDPARGGSVEYATPPGMVHTSYMLLSCEPGGPPTCGGMAPPQALWESRRKPHNYRWNLGCVFQRTQQQDCNLAGRRMVLAQG